MHEKYSNFMLGRNGRSEADRRQPDYKLKLKETSLFSFHQLRKILEVNRWQVGSEKQIRFGTRWCRSV